MISSMTGYGEGEAHGAGWSVAARMKTLNHRFLEVAVRGLEEYEALELRTRELVQERFHRGRIEVMVRLERAWDEGIAFDPDTARRHWNGLRELARELGIGEPVTLDHLLRLESALVPVPPDPEGLWPVLERAVEASVEAVQAQRRREGQALAADLSELTRAIEEGISWVRTQTPQLKQRYRERLEARVRELAPELQLDPQRLEQEVALLAEHSDITEELARLEIHLQAVRDALKGEGPAGRRLDFLGQEMYREGSTMAAKAKDGEISQRLVGIKAQIERLREQVRNIE